MFGAQVAEHHQLHPGPVSKFFDEILGPDEALEIDRKDIFKHADTNIDFIKGFVIIESDVELDVVAVYTAAGREQQIFELFLFSNYLSVQRQMMKNLPLVELHFC